MTQSKKYFFVSLKMTQPNLHFNLDQILAIRLVTTTSRLTYTAEEGRITVLEGEEVSLDIIGLNMDNETLVKFTTSRYRVKFTTSRYRVKFTTSRYRVKFTTSRCLVKVVTSRYIRSRSSPPGI